MDTGISQRAAQLPLIRRLMQYWQRRQSRWLASRVPAVSALTLGRRTIFIMPTPQGALIGIVALAISLIALAERNVVAVLLASLVLSLFLVCLILTYRNMSGLLVKNFTVRETGLKQNCFEGENALFLVQLDAAGHKRNHHQLSIGFDKRQMQTISVIKGIGTGVELQQKALRRGIMSAPRLQIGSEYPLGLWRAWSRPDLSMQCLVYPRPMVCKLPVNFYYGLGVQTGSFKSTMLRGNDDFMGLREYQQGDTPRQIHWQSLAIGHGLQTRHFVREQQPELMLDWEMFSSRDKEEILSCLCYQVLQLSRRQIPFGMRLPGTFEAPDSGDLHKHRVLAVLAIFPSEHTHDEAKVS